MLEAKEIYQKIKNGKADIHDFLVFIHERELGAFDRGYNHGEKIGKETVNTKV